MAAATYALPTDEIGRAATITLSTATADAKYPVTNVNDFNPAKPFLTSSSGTAVDIDWDSGGAVDVKLFSLHHHNIPAGTNVRLQRGASQGATTMDAAVTIPALPADGLPLPVGVDLTGVSGYGNYRWTRLHIPSLAQKVGIGSALLWSAKRTDIRNARYPAKENDQHPRRTFDTYAGVANELLLKVRVRSHPCDFTLQTADYTAIVTLVRACMGVTNSFLWWRDFVAGSSDAWLARFTDDTLSAQLPSGPAVFTLSVTIQERACGLALPTA